MIGPYERPLMGALLLVSGLAASFSSVAEAASMDPVAPARDVGSTPPKALAHLPIREITVFKDGHAFVLHEGDMPTDESGDVVLDNLPAPVLGTFWPFSADASVKLESVVAGRRHVSKERTATDLRELLMANVGARVMVFDGRGYRYPATILGIPKPTGTHTLGDALGTPARITRPRPDKEIILLKTDMGVKIVPLKRIEDVTFLTEPKRSLTEETVRDVLTMHLGWAGRAPEKTAHVGLVYLQKGIRWIPGYRVTIDGAGMARVEMQATLINELADLKGVTAHLVIGVPTFAFKDTADPMAVQGLASRLSPYFHSSAQTGFAFSNAIMTQAPRMTEVRSYRAARPPGSLEVLSPNALSSAKREDLFLFTVKNVTLKKDERMVLPIAVFTVPYRDVYKLNLASGPPPQVRRSFNTQRQAELARLLTAPKVMHYLRLTNDSPYPFTTAPALIIRNDRIVAQGMMTYTAVGAAMDLELTTAVNIRVAKSDVEIARVPRAEQWNNHWYDRIGLEGRVSLTNYGDRPVDLEVVRHVWGNADTADANGKINAVNVHEEGWSVDGGGLPTWWNWYSWPSWWHRFNGIGRITWQVTLEPGKSRDLRYTWHYLWG